jgi:hypothetical protein
MVPPRGLFARRSGSDTVAVATRCMGSVGGVAVTKDWRAWHEPYADASSPLSRRLRLVRRHIGLWLDARQGEALTAVSACAGQGHDLLGVLATRADAHRVRATLLEGDERNVAAAQAAAANLPNDADVYRTVQALPELCASGATVIWTRSRRAPDLTPTLRCWLKEAGFVEHAFHAPDGVLFSVGVHRFAGVPVPLSLPGRLFQFVT